MTGSKLIRSSFVIGAASVCLAAQCAAGPLSERILFVANPVGLAKIYIVRPDTKDFARLTHGRGIEREPDVSLPLAAVAYRSNRDGNSEIYRCNLAGGEITRLTHDPGADRHPSWSPDGSRIVFATQRWGQEELAIMDGRNGDSQGLLRLTWDQSQNCFPAWSPKGDLIAYSSCQQGQADLYIISPDGQTRRRLTREYQPDVRPRWSPDGTQIVYQTQRGPRNSPAVAICTVASGEVRVLATQEIAILPTFSPDGQNILFVGLGTRLRPRPPQMQIYNLANGEVRKFEIPRLSDTSPLLQAQESEWTPFPFPW